MNYRRILVFGAHPDDEIRMAGTMVKLAASGVQVNSSQVSRRTAGEACPCDHPRVVPKAIAIYRREIHNLLAVRRPDWYASSA